MMATTGTNRGCTVTVTSLLIIVASILLVGSTAFTINTNGGRLVLGSAATKCPLFTKSSSLSTTSTTSTTRSSTTSLSMVATAAPDTKKKKQQPYKPKWVKKQTLAESSGDIGTLGHAKVGLKGTIPVLFKQGNNTITTKAWAGQPIRDVASQAGQFIQYGCGKGECGTCECKMNGKWIRPCVETVPASAITSGELVLQLKEMKSKSTSSGTFFSIRSFFMGFWNNLLGMVGFAKWRKKAQANWLERKQYEDSVRQKTLEHKLLRQQRELEELNRKAIRGDGTPYPFDWNELEQTWNDWIHQVFPNLQQQNNLKNGWHSTVRKEQEIEEGLMWYI